MSTLIEDLGELVEQGYHHFYFDRKLLIFNPVNLEEIVDLSGSTISSGLMDQFKRLNGGIFQTVLGPPDDLGWREPFLYLWADRSSQTARVIMMIIESGFSFYLSLNNSYNRCYFPQNCNKSTNRNEIFLIRQLLISLIRERYRHFVGLTGIAREVEVERVPYSNSKEFILINGARSVFQWAKNFLQSLKVWETTERFVITYLGQFDQFLSQRQDLGQIFYPEIEVWLFSWEVDWLRCWNKFSAKSDAWQYFTRTPKDELVMISI